MHTERDTCNFLNGGQPPCSSTILGDYKDQNCNCYHERTSLVQDLGFLSCIARLLSLPQIFLILHASTMILGQVGKDHSSKDTHLFCA